MKRHVSPIADIGPDDALRIDRICPVVVRLRTMARDICCPYEVTRCDDFRVLDLMDDQRSFDCVCTTLADACLTLVWGRLETSIANRNGIFLLSYAIVPFAGGFKMFLVAMVILTIGEMFIWPAVPAMAARLAPIGKEGEFQGYVNIAASAGRMISPTVGGLIYDVSGMDAVFLTLIGLIILAGFTFVRAVPKPKKIGQ